MNGAWTLPSDTVQAIWQNAFPELMQLLWKPREDEVAEAKIAEAKIAERGHALDHPHLGTWLRWRFTEDGVGPNDPRHPVDTLHITTLPALRHTYVVHDRGLALPRFVDSADCPSTPFPEGGVGQGPPPGQADGPDDKTLRDALQTATGAEPVWFIRGSEFELLRLAASIETVMLWRSGPDFGRARKATFREDVWRRFLTLAGRPEASPPQWFTVDHFKVAHIDRDSRNDPLFNPEDGAGNFTSTGYTMYGPPPPPVLDGLMASYSFDAWTGKAGEKGMAYPCAGYAPRQAYATPCSCIAENPANDPRVFVRTDERISSVGAATMSPPGPEDTVPLGDA